jgi:HEAT repeat protein
VEGPWPQFEELLAGLDGPDRHARCRAVQGLGEGRDPRAVEPLLRMLRDPAGDVRAKATVALGRFRDERALGPLIGAMGDEKVSVRDGASAAVKKFGKRAYRPLLEAYKGANGASRSALVAALASYKTPEVSELLIAALDDPNGRFHLEVARLLGRRKDRRAVERLVAGIEAATIGIGRVAGLWEEAGAECSRSIEHLQAEMAHWAESAVRLETYLWALGEIGDPAAFGSLWGLLEIPTIPDLLGLVPALVEALRKIDNARAVDLVHRLLDNPSRPDRDRLEMTLAGMGLVNATRALLASGGGKDPAILGPALQSIRAADQAGQAPAERMNRLEWEFRALARGRPGA